MRSLFALLTLTMPVALGAATQAQSDQQQQAAQDAAPITVTPAFSFTNDWLHSKGGAADGNANLMRAEGRLVFDFRARRSVAFDFGAIGGQSISALAADVQGTSNIEGPRSVRVFDLFYQMPTGAGSGMVRAGIIDLNAFFYVQGDAAANFLNASHGIGPEFSHSGPNGPSIYPHSRPAAMIEQPAGKVTVRVGAFDASPNAPRSVEGVFTSNVAHGPLLVGEVDAGGARAGAWDYTGSSRGLHGDSGAYAVLDFQPGRSLGAWLTAGVSNAVFNPVNSYLGGGVLKKLGNASFGVALASAGFPGNARRETNIEFTVPLDLGHGFTVQPDLQVIANPAGNHGTAWVAGLRLQYNYEGTPTTHAPMMRRHRIAQPAFTN